MYKEVVRILDTLTPRIKFARVDLAKNNFLKKHMGEGDEVPVLYAVKKGKFYKYHENWNLKKILHFIDRMYLPLITLTTEETIDEFLTPPQGNQNFLTLVAFIYDEDESEDSLIKQYEKTSLALSNWINCKVGVVKDKALIKDFKNKGKYIPYLNSLVLSKRGADFKVLDLALPQNLGHWITRNGVGLVEELTPYNFQIYKGISLPMLIMFLDKTNTKQDEYLDMFTKAARDFENDVKFVYLDGNEPVNIQRRRKLGLITDMLPSLAFNLADGRVYPHDESKEITKESILSFVTEFLEHKEQKGTIVSNYKQDYEIETLYRNTPILTKENFEKVALTEGDDIFVLFYSSSNNPDSISVAPYFNKLAKRYGELEFPNLKIFRYDVGVQSVYKNIKTDKVPVMYMFPAFHKKSPYIQYTGETTVIRMMFFIQKYSDVKFELPDLPHLNPYEVEEYWESKSKLPHEKQEKVAASHEIRQFDL